MSDIIEKQMSEKKAKKFEPGAGMPASLIGTAGTTKSLKDEKALKETIKHIVAARRKGQKKV